MKKEKIDYKKGGGNKEQAFIPEGNGEHSGEYCEENNRNYTIRENTKIYIKIHGGSRNAYNNAKTYFEHHSLRESAHFLDRFLRRGIPMDAVTETLITPDIKTEPIIDIYGRKSFKLITYNVTVVINPTNHLLLTVYPTNKANRNKISKGETK